MEECLFEKSKNFINEIFLSNFTFFIDNFIYFFILYCFKLGFAKQLSGT